MPIEIRELHIKVTVNQPEAANSSNAVSSPSTNNSSVKNESLLAECVEQVMQILQNKNER